MAVSLYEKASPYEVRCLRCDVSFPVGTRTCLHCGGPTEKPGEVVHDDSLVFSEIDYGIGSSGSASAPDSMSHRLRDSGPIEPVSESPFGMGGSAAMGGSSSTTGGSSSTTGGSAGTSIGDAIRNAVSETGRGRDRKNDRELETDDAPRSVFGGLIRSLGGLIWVILLIGFSLARSCGD